MKHKIKKYLFLGINNINSLKMTLKIYFAGPLFTTAEREWNTKLANILRASGFSVYLPQEFEPRDEEILTASKIFNMDIDAVDAADCVLAIMDGADPDSGTCFEVGYAYRKKPIFTIRTDFRRAGDVDSDFNLMLTESSIVIKTNKEMPSTDEVGISIINTLKSYYQL